MVCIYCGSATQVSNSRLQKRLNQVWRRRQCISCGNTFTTHEAVDLSTSIAVQYSPRKLTSFDKDTLLISIYESCKHRQTAVGDAAALAQTVVAHLRVQLKDGAIARNTIIETTIAVLDRFDKTAATVYKAYHPLTIDVVKHKK